MLSIVVLAQFHDYLAEAMSLWKWDEPDSAGSKGIN